MSAVVICGAAGRMGRTLTQAVFNHPSLRLGGALESPSSPDLGMDAGVLAGVGDLGVPISSDPRVVITGTDLVIDFSAPESSITVSKICRELGIGVVIGTTGFTESQLLQLEDVSHVIPMLISPNMSIGVNVTFKLLEMAAKTLGRDVDTEIYEIHHRFKADAPSGTAVRMGEIVASALDSKLEDIVVYGREGITGERATGKIGFHSARGGDVVGEHTVTFAGTGERIEITHRAGSRANFAAGAMRAATFILDKKSRNEVGLFDMNEVLGLA